MIFSFEHLEVLILHYKYILLFPIAIFEGPIVTMLAGFLVAQGYLDFWLAYILVIIGDEIGDILHYAVGFFGGMHFVRRFGKYFGVSENELTTAKKIFTKKGRITILFSKVLHGIGGVFQVVAGAVRMSFPEFVSYTFIGTVIKAYILLEVGFYFGHSISTIDSYLDIAALWGFFGLTLFVGVFLSRKFFKRFDR